MTPITLLGLSIVEQAQSLCNDISQLPEDERVAVLNAIKLALHEVSPHKDEPVDCVIWVKAETVEANEYNPNRVAPPEMKLLELSIDADGYTQPIVVFPENGGHTVVDGENRHRVGKESKKVQRRVKGYLPVTIIRPSREGYEDRVAATIRHNRARGKHQVALMSDIVQELTRRNWSREKIGRELGMDDDEVLRLQQISGLAEMFANREFSQAWEIEGEQNGNEDEG
jgi:ParB-like chromosome segregation protein Spo0J